MASKKGIPCVVGLGEVVFDILPDSRKLGGAPVDFLNFAVKSGAQGYLISAIGADDLGREVMSELKKISVTPVLAVTPYPTGRVLIFKSLSNGYTAHTLENAAWDYIPFTTAAEECIKKADCVYFDTLAMRKSYSKETLLDLIDEAPETAYRFFDVNFRQDNYDKDLIVQLLNRANILKLNNDELKIIKTLLNLSGTTDGICRKLKQSYELKYLIFTKGATESFVYGDDEITVASNSRLQQIFAYGAGNAFAGAFISAILQDKSQREAHDFANNIAGQMCKVKK